MNDQDLAKIDELLQKRFQENNIILTTELMKQIRLEIKESATKVTKDISNLVTDLVQEISDQKAGKDEILSLDVRVDKLERKVFPQSQ